ncbi:MAG: hypothetical protein ACXVAF_08375 [Vulcanimicrobiaceae bacterium]
MTMTTSVLCAKHGSHCVAYLLEAPEPSASPSPAPSASPLPENKKKAEASTLVLRNLDAGTTENIESVSEYALSDDEHDLAYATETAKGAGDGVHMRDLRSDSAPIDVLSGSGRYTNLIFSPQTGRLAFLSDTMTSAPAYGLACARVTATEPT